MKNKLKDDRMQIFWANNILFDEYGQKIGEHALIVYLCLTRHANNNNTCFPSTKRIALECGIKSRQTIVNALKTLAKYKLISIEHRTLKSGGQTSNLYRLLPVSDSTPPVYEIDTPCLNNTLPPVYEIDTPCLQNGHEGLQYKDNNIKDNNTKDSCGVVGLIFPKELKQSQPNLAILNKLPNDKAKQEVLDAMGLALGKGTIKTPTAYLRTLVNSSLKGELEIVASKEDSCPYCDKRGKDRILKMTKPSGFDYDELCSHDKVEIEARIAKGHKLRSGIGRKKTQTKQPTQPQNTTIEELPIVPPPKGFDFGKILKTLH